MSDEDAKLVKNLDRLLFEDTGEEPEEVRRRLEAKGVDVKGLIARVKAVAGDAYREALRDEAAQEYAGAWSILGGSGSGKSQKLLIWRRRYALCCKAPTTEWVARLNKIAPLRSATTCVE